MYQLYDRNLMKLQCLANLRCEIRASCYTNVNESGGSLRIRHEEQRQTNFDS